MSQEDSKPGPNQSQSPHLLARAVMQQTDCIVEEGWKILRHLRNVRKVHIHDKEYFFAGAAYMFDAMLSASLSEGTEANETDMEILNKLSAELRRFNDQFNQKVRLK